MGQGVLITGDFNGDKRTDVFHAVAGADWANVWTSNGNGTFTVSAFKPWPGYGMDGGIWLTGDFNSDGRTDILHAISGTDYANVWLSNGNGTFTVSSFQPWPGYAMGQGVLLTGDFNGDKRTDVFHAVAGADWANVWTSHGNGTFTVSAFKPWPGYGMDGGIWLTGDFNSDGRTDILHAISGT